MQPSPATSSQGKSSTLGEVLGSQKNHIFSAIFRDFLWSALHSWRVQMEHPDFFSYL